MIRRRLVAVMAANPSWGTARKPLYARSKTGSAREISTTVLDCTSGDAITASIVLIAALLGTPVWPDLHVRAVIVAAPIGSVGYTTYGGYVNTAMQRSRDYTADATVVIRQRLIDYLKATTRETPGERGSCVMWGHGSGWMMSYGSGWGGSGWMMIFGGLFWLVLIAFGVMWFVSASRRRDPPSAPAERSYPPLEILEQRYARGEINRTEYLEKKDDLLGRSEAGPPP